MHVELQLLSRVIRTGQLADVLEWGIQEDDFRTTEGRGLFNHLLGYWKASETSGAVPGEKSFEQMYPAFEFCDDASMTLDALCAEVRKMRIILETREAMTEANEVVDIEPITAVSRLLDRLMMTRSLGMKSHDDLYSSAIDEQVRRYQLAERGIQTCCFHWPWDPLNEATGGVQDDDYIVIYGRPKSKKTFVLGEFIASTYDQGKCVMVYTKEMPTWQIYRRVTAAIARLPYEEYRLGKLSPEHRRDFYMVADMIRTQARATSGRHNIIAVSGRDAPAGQDNMMWLRGKVEKYKPDAVFIDGLYLMSADRKTGKDHERVMQISRAARQMVLDTHVPVIATMQANRQASKNGDAELDEIAYSDAIGQDATCAIRSINEKTSPPTIALVLAGSREFQLNGIRIGGMPYSDLSFKEAMTDKEVAKAKAKDADEEEKKKKDEPKPIRTPVSSKIHNKTLDDQLKNVQ
jgi:hypothetical protein